MLLFSLLLGPLLIALAWTLHLTHIGGPNTHAAILLTGSALIILDNIVAIGEFERNNCQTTAFNTAMLAGTLAIAAGSLRAFTK